MKTTAKKNSIEQLSDAILLAEAFGETESDNDINIAALTEEYLSMGDTPKRRVLRAEMAAGHE
ncbi:MAG: hypothetical protein RR956_08365, partial [Christensenella sp.]